MRINKSGLSTPMRPADSARVKHLRTQAGQARSPVVNSDIVLASRFRALAVPEKQLLLVQAAKLEGKIIANEHDLLVTLLRWPGVEQMSAILGVTRRGIKCRTKEGDIRAFVEIGGHKRFHAEKTIAEYTYFLQNKNAIMAERQLRAQIRAMPQEQLALLSRFVREETGVAAFAADELFEACRGWFNRSSLSKYLHLDFNVMNKLIASREIRVFTARFSQGNPLVLISPAGIAAIQKEIQQVLAQAKPWYKNNYYAEIELNTLDELYSSANFI